MFGLTKLKKTYTATLVGDTMSAKLRIQALTIAGAREIARGYFNVTDNVDLKVTRD